MDACLGAGATCMLLRGTRACEAAASSLVWTLAGAEAFAACPARGANAAFPVLEQTVSARQHKRAPQKCCFCVICGWLPAHCSARGSALRLLLHALRRTPQLHLLHWAKGGSLVLSSASSHSRRDVL